jgi:hypothetical protein
MWTRTVRRLRLKLPAGSRGECARYCGSVGRDEQLSASKRSCMLKIVMLTRLRLVTNVLSLGPLFAWEEYLWAATAVILLCRKARI